MSITISGDGDINATGNDIELNSTGTTDVTLALGGGSVGVGVASPTATLDVNGTIKLDGNYPVGTRNVALGDTALDSITSGAFNNIAIGDAALTALTDGDNNVAVGRSALISATTAQANTSIGHETLVSLTTGGFNAAIGAMALNSNTTASNLVAVGYQAGYSNTTGTNSVYIGHQSGDAVTTANSNTFVGRASGGQTTTGGSNSFFGEGSGGGNVTGAGNTFLGHDSGSLVTGSKNTIIGRYNGNQNGLDIRTSNNNIVLSDGDGNPKAWWDSGYNCKLRMGSGGGTNTMKYNTSTYEVTFDTSSARYKENIRDSIYGLNAVLSLSAKQFEYKKDGRSDIGLIAEEVVSVIPELVGTDADGRPDSVTYDRMVSVLVKAIQELSAKNDALEARLAALENA